MAREANKMKFSRSLQRISNGSRNASSPMAHFLLANLWTPELVEEVRAAFWIIPIWERKIHSGKN